MPNPIFSRESIRLRIPKFRELVPVPSFKTTRYKTPPISQANLCWVGACSKCGRTLISAVDHPTVPYDKYECGICE